MMVFLRAWSQSIVDGCRYIRQQHQPTSTTFLDGYTIWHMTQSTIAFLIPNNSSHRTITTYLICHIQYSKNDSNHGQITEASFFSLSNNASVDSTKMPGCYSSQSHGSNTNMRRIVMSETSLWEGMYRRCVMQGWVVNGHTCFSCGGFFHFHHHIFRCKINTNIGGSKCLDGLFLSLRKMCKW